MRRLISIVFVGGLLLLSYAMMAQKSKKDDGKPVPASDTPAPKIVHAYLGRSSYNNGEISKRTFDSLLKQGLTARDAQGTQLKVDGFTFSYAERNLYEDSVGKLMVLTDFFSEFCTGDTVSRGVSMNIYYKTKPGDTAYFDNIKVLLPDGRPVGTKGMKFVLTK
jgi:hypothetical protein